MLKILDELPRGFMEAWATDLYRLLGGPTLICLKGRREPALIVSVLQHGNEASGFEAIQSVLARYTHGGGNRDLPRSLVLFVGNVAAAAEGLRRLPDGPDYNRIWPHEDGDAGGSRGAEMMAGIVAEVGQRGLFAAIDTHNTTGPNPHYGCVATLDAPALYLASFFSRTIVYMAMPKGIQTMALSKLCPSVALECGQVGDAAGATRAARYIDGILHLSHFPEHPVPPHDYEIFHTVARVTLEAGTDFDFGGDDRADVSFRTDLDRLNFTELPEGTDLGRVANGTMPLSATDESGLPITDRYFALREGRLVTRAPLMPSMLTRNTTIIRQDCLCYLMERFGA